MLKEWEKTAIKNLLKETACLSERQADTAVRLALPKIEVWREDGRSLNVIAMLVLVENGL